MNNEIILWAAIATIIVAVLTTMDFVFKRWNYLKKFGQRVHKQVLAFMDDQTYVTLKIPPPSPVKITAPAPDKILQPPPTEFPAPIPVKPVSSVRPLANVISSVNGVNKVLIKYIMRGAERLMAYEIVKEGFPTGYLVEFAMRDKEPKSCANADYRVANAQWHEWYKEWKQQPGGFGGSSGTGLDGTLPW